MADKDKLTINVRVGNVLHRIIVRRDEERLYRSAEQLVNNRLNHYAQTMPGHQDSDYLHMLVLDIALAYCRNQDRNDIEPFVKSMTALTGEIEQKLKEQS